MGNLANNPHFIETIRKWLKPGDESVLLRAASALEETAAKVRADKGAIVLKGFVAGTIATAADMIKDAAGIVIATPAAKPEPAPTMPGNRVDSQSRRHR